MAIINLDPVNEIMNARRTLHGGSVGAPVKLVDGSREGDALNRACVVALTGAMQYFVEEVFVECSEKQFGINLGGDHLKRYRQTWNRWGNPSADNIINLFRRIGIDDALEGLSWQKQTSNTWKKNLNKINEIRNCIAHGKPLKTGGEEYNLRFSVITQWRNSVERFGDKFPAHVEGLLE